jgi:hypothetical protein
VRILAPLSLVLTVLCVFAVVTTALGQEAPAPHPPPAAPAAGDVPALFPISTPALSATNTPPVRSTGIAEPVVIGAVYWLLLGGLALRRKSQLGRPVD